MVIVSMPLSCAVSLIGIMGNNLMNKDIIRATMAILPSVILISENVGL